MSPKSHALSCREMSPEGFEHRLNLYHLAAIAAGVGLMALSQTATGEVVVTHKTLYLGNGTDGAPPVPIDFNKDGKLDAFFQQNSFGYGYGTAGAWVWAHPAEGAAFIVNGHGTQLPYVAALFRGAQVGPSAQFSSAKSATIERTAQSTSNEFSVCGINRQLKGNFPGNTPDRFIGVKFLINGEIHYGWVRLSLDTTAFNNCEVVSKITAYAYETEANKPITIGSGAAVMPKRKQNSELSTPPDPSLGMLALGSDGLALWRRESELLP